MKNIGWLVILVVVFGSCRKKEKPIEKHAIGDVIQVQVDLKKDYRYQIYYSIEKNEIISQELRTDWDLKLSNSEANHYIMLNSSNAMAIDDLDLEKFKQKVLVNNREWKYDASSGDLDSTAFGEWWKENPSFVLDLGYNYEGDRRGYKQIHFTLEGDTYVIQWTTIDGDSLKTMKVKKDPVSDWTYLSLLGDGNVIQTIPDQSQWDILFTQYTHIFQEPYQPYQVTGAIINSNKVKVAIDKDRTFSEINLDLAESYTFSDQLDIIGYNWKFYDIKNSSYTIFDHYNYILKMSNGKFFKLHFTDFYDESGEKGSPNFEFQEL